MDNRFFEKPVINSPYEYPKRHWELDDDGQPTQRIIEHRRIVKFITPIPKPRKRKKGAIQQQFIFDEGKGLSTEAQQYDPTPIINQLRVREEAKKNNEAARVWISGLETVSRKLGVNRIIDLSAMPFFLRGSSFHRLDKAKHKNFRRGSRQ